MTSYLVSVVLFTLLSYPCLVSSDECSYYCQFPRWKCWNACSRPCGGGTRLRTRGLCCKTYMTIAQCKQDCGVTSDDLRETGTCNQICENGGTYAQSGCLCESGFFGYCCQQSDSTRMTSSTCSWAEWAPWSDCEGSESGSRSRQREPVCAVDETRTDCMSRCRYNDNKGEAWQEEACVTGVCYSAATTLTHTISVTAAATTVSTLLFVLCIYTV